MKKRIKAELWDKTQYILSKYYDRMMHVAIYSEGDLDLQILRRAIKKVVDNVYVLRSRYSANIFKHHWVVNDDYTLDDMATKEEVADLKGATEEFLKGYISHRAKLQFRAKVFTSGNSCSFALLVNHQCFDGNELKYVTGKIIECYNAIIREGNADSISIRNGSRAMKQLYEKMDPKKAAIAKKLYNNASKMGVKSHFRFTQEKDVEKRFVTGRLDISIFDKLKQRGKEYGASINDVILAAYFRAYAKEAGINNDEVLNITSIIDLRRHLMKGEQLDGCTNMVAFMPCKIDGVGETYIDTLKKVAAINNAHKEDEVVGLYGIPLLALAYKIFRWDFIANMAVRIGYENPVMQMSNLGKISNSCMTFEGCKPVDVFVTGAVKNRPYFQLTCVSMDTHINFCIAEKCSETDERYIKIMLENMKKDLVEFAQ